LATMGVRALSRSLFGAGLVHGPFLLSTVLRGIKLIDPSPAVPGPAPGRSGKVESPGLAPLMGQQGSSVPQPRPLRLATMAFAAHQHTLPRRLVVGGGEARRTRAAQGWRRGPPFGPPEPALPHPPRERSGAPASQHLANGWDFPVRSALNDAVRPSWALAGRGDRLLGSSIQGWLRRSSPPRPEPDGQISGGRFPLLKKGEHPPTWSNFVVLQRKPARCSTCSSRFARESRR